MVARTFVDVATVVAAGFFNNPGMAIARLVHLVKHACVHPNAEDHLHRFVLETVVVECNLNFDLDVIYDVISLDWKMAPCGTKHPSGYKPTG